VGIVKRETEFAELLLVEFEHVVRGLLVLVERFLVDEDAPVVLGNAHSPGRVRLRRRQQLRDRVRVHSSRTLFDQLGNLRS
jgi:hypothetical protein